MPLNWINAEEYPFNSILLMDRWILRYFVGMGQSGAGSYDDPEYRKNLGVALAYNPSIRWYFENRCPESMERVALLTRDIPMDLTGKEVRTSEIYVLQAQESFIVYVYPDVMESQCAYIRDWSPCRLLSLADFTNKVVLDIGSGTGRLAFAAARKAKKVYASEPVDRLREFIRDKIKKMGITNIVVLDGTVEVLPFEDNTFDIVTSAYVVGDDYDAEYSEMTRVVKSGGFVIVCDGEEARFPQEPNKELLRLGFEYSGYASQNGGEIYRYLKQIIKP